MITIKIKQVKSVKKFEERKKSIEWHQKNTKISQQQIKTYEMIKTVEENVELKRGT